MGYLKKHLFLLILLAIGIAAFIRGILFLDSDFGWHLKMGELILQKGIPLTDPFSYTMSSYPFIDHEWLTNILISIGYKTIGIYGLAFIFALIFVLALYLAVPRKFKNYSFLPLTLAGGLMLGFAGIRTQLITWFFLALLLKVIFDVNLWKKWKIFIPLLFILWVNLHGGFAVGIVVIFLIFIIKSFQAKKIQFQDLFIVTASSILTLINPYGIGIWHEVWMVTADNFARWNISEWLPGIFYTDFSLLAMFALSFSFLLRYRAKIGKLQIFVYLFLFLMAVSSIRHIPLWALSAIFITGEGIYLLVNEIGKSKESIFRLNMLKKILFVFMVFVFLSEVIIDTIGAFNLSEQNYYPVKAVEYLKRQNITDGNLFTLYNYGGYLIWKLPGKKVFIDGRMPSWRRDSVFVNESNYAFKDYLKMLGSENYFRQMLKKYNIHYFLLPSRRRAEDSHVPAFIIKFRELAQKLTLFKTNMKVVDGDLIKMGLKQIYNDGHFTIYKS